jgi:hypothetical protein
MKKQIIHFSVHQTSKAIASLYAAVIAVLFVFPMGLYHIFFLGNVVGGLLVIFLVPLFYWVALYIGHLIGCWFYNTVARYFGGIEFEMIDVDHPVIPSNYKERDEHL